MSSPAQVAPASPVLSQDYLVCFVNGKKYQLYAKDIQPESTLLHFLRQTCGLTGTKLVCGEGGCGACTVLLSKVDHSTGRVNHLSVNACLYPLGAVDGAHVITVEGVGNPSVGLHPIQIRLAELNGSQCGFCTPGIVMAFYALIRNNPNPTQKEIEHVMDGNLCRCTGYRPILDATKSFASDRDNVCGMGENCCRNKKNKPIASEDTCKPDTPFCDGMKLNQSCSCQKIHDLSAVTPAAPLPQAFREDSALIFPPFLMKYNPQRIEIKKQDSTWIKPHDLADLVGLKTAFPDAKLVCGNTEAGIDMKFRFDSRPWKTMIYCSDVKELKTINHTATSVNGVKGIEVGASVTINQLQLLLNTDYDNFDAASQNVAQSIMSQIHWFAGTQIRNVATLAGNICTASPISDLNPVWQAVDGVVMRVAKAGRAEDRFISGAKFFTGYRQTAMEPQEVLVSVFIPVAKKSENVANASGSASVSQLYTHAYKQSRRRADDIAIVTACLQMSVEKSGDALLFKEVNLSYGGMAPATALALKTAAWMKGKPATLATVHAAVDVLKQDFPLLDAKVLPGGMAEYRMVLAASFLLKMYYFLWKNLRQVAVFESLIPAFPAELDASTLEYERDVSAGTQTYRVRETNFGPAESSAAASSSEEKSNDPHEHGGEAKMAVNRVADRNLVGDPSSTHPAKSGEAIRHMSALMQTSGEAKYADDIALVRNEAYVGLVLSTEPYARILSIDTSALEAHPAYQGFWSSKDIPGANDIGDIIHDEECLASEFVVCVGTIIAVVLGSSQIEANQLAKLVKVNYEKLTPIVTIEDAIAANSYIAPWQDGHTILSGDVDAALASAPHTLSGEARIGGQEHFYLETMSFILTPGEGDNMHVTGTSQNPNKTQQYVARVLGIGAHQVTCSVKRMGGGFGGKETRCLHIIAACAIAAKKSRRTVRLILDRDQDMALTGQRHAFLGKYKVGFDNDGKILGTDVQLYANGGCSADLTMPVVDRALFHIENSYRFGACRFVGKPCKTHTPSNTAFRGFGGPQGMFVGESIIDAVARHLRLAPEVVRQRNLYHQGDRTPYKQQLTEYTVPQQFEHVVQKVNLAQKREEIAAFNAKNKHVKRGLSIVPTKFGISFTAKFLNQAGALVLVYSDGTVLINHGGCEMGQGLHTKMCQVAAHAFNIPLSKVSLSDTSTDKVANASPTAASASSDLNGAAVLDACNQILKRLEPLRAKFPNKSWSELVSAAYFERIGLGATGFYRTPDVGYDFNNPGDSTPFNYYTTGVAYSEVEVDTLTGDFTTLSSHICMDVGVPINPTIDIGQVEGAFVQGMGLFTIEELVWGDSAHPWVRPGNLQTKGPGTYKIPTANDIPLSMHVELWKGGQNSRAIFSSKGVGEPPLFMAASVFFAIKDALQAARVQNIGADEAHNIPFVLNSPATAERIRMAACDELTGKFMKPNAEKGAEKTFQTFGSF